MNMINITLSPKSFYNNSDQREIHRNAYKLEQKNQKKSPTRHLPHYRRIIRRHRIRGINAGVSHSIRKPKFKTCNIRKTVSVGQIHEQPKKPIVNSFDATDLIADEPELDGAMTESDVVNILKVLEDDWAEDDYDTMETLSNKNINNASVLKPTSASRNDTMASELNSQTSVTNSININTALPLENISSNNNADNIKENGQKYFPIFSKGYSADKALDHIDKKSRHDNKENANRQLSVKQNGDENQYQIDAGQKNFGATQCTECGIVYQIGDPEDENAHLNYHNNRKSLKFPGWKTERVIMEDPVTSSRVILVEPSDSKQYWKKVNDILTYVDRDLGLADMNVSDYENHKVYLYISDKSVLGVLVAEHISTAYRMIPELLELNCCTAESTPAKCGINIVWTDMNHRRTGIATKLVDILRSHFYYGYIMSLDDIAFSIPTPSGKIFAENYTKTRNFKVY